jgi:hypothetical protein
LQLPNNNTSLEAKRARSKPSPVTSFSMPGHKQVAAAKRRERDEAIERYVKTHFGEKGLQGDTLNEYTRADATLIVKKIEAREWTATAVLKAYLQRALVAHRALNAITEGMNALESLFYTLYSTEQLWRPLSSLRRRS